HRDTSPPERRRWEEFARSQYAAVLSDFRLAERPAQAYRDLLALCRDEHIPAALLVMPEGSAFRGLYPPQGRVALDAFLADLSREFAVPLIDARSWVDDDGFWDGHHLEAGGAEVFTERFGREALRPLLSRRGRAP